MKQNDYFFKGTALFQLSAGIYQVYLCSFDLNGDAVVRVPFRVNAAHKASFEKIYEEKLQKYNIDFTNYVRTLLGEYAIKPYYQRELFFHYRFFKEMQRAISRQNVGRYTNGEKLVKFIPAAIEPFFSSENGNCLLGISLYPQTGGIPSGGGLRLLFVKTVQVALLNASLREGAKGGGRDVKNLSEFFNIPAALVLTAESRHFAT